MIAFSAMGSMGRLGNQMFQYAFLRNHAAKLQTRFHCPPWEGDLLFDLGDEAQREQQQPELRNQYREPPYSPGFDARALHIPDGTEISGYFQSWRYFEAAPIHEWFRFRPESVGEGRRLMDGHRARRVAGVHVRLGDYLGEYRDRYYIARRSYYAQAMAPVAATHRILVFSDDPAYARDYLRGLWRDAVYVSGMSAGDDLYAMTRCERLACSPSSFSWWAGRLGNPERVVVVPREGPFRLGAQYSNTDFWPPQWTALRGLLPVLDHVHAVRLWNKARSITARLKGVV